MEIGRDLGDLSVRGLGWPASSMKRVVEPGDFDLMVGPNSVETANVTLTVEPR